ncbi:histidine phosphatase family protein [Nakamurella leprariae]|uniref:MSMEG_4193 family putative phosphomutase n=1 Tax=Nakamurella leprariae TaxID=2803911 RepID=A0A938YA90_9ACTN|nr:MSMEG_4193 family putative phosphomutase [Nakamurella leprariae]
MTTVLLLRHGRSTANTAGVLAGRTPGVDLDDVGREQAARVVTRLASVPLHALVTSPLQRCRQTIAPLAEATGLPITVDERLAEVDYGSWSGRPLKDLVKEEMWRTVQQHPSAAVFPGGEGLAEVSSRAVRAVRQWAGGPGTEPDALPVTSSTADRDAEAGHTIVLCSHGDVIKAILADALGMHLDCFQRIVVGPASISVIRYTPLRPFVERINDTGDLAAELRPAPATAPPGAGGADGQTPTLDPATAASEAVPGGVTR